MLDRVIENANAESIRWIEADPDFDPIREHPRHRAMIANAKARLGMNE
jgi:hypothetical protein